MVKFRREAQFRRVGGICNELVKFLLNLGRAPSRRRRGAPDQRGIWCR